MGKGDKQGSKSGAAAWTMASRVGSQASQLLVFLVAARFLSPEEFGYFSLISAINILMTRLVAAGWLEFIAAFRGEREVEAHAFSLSILAGLVATVLNGIAAWVFLGLPELAPYASLQAMLAVSLVGIGVGALWEGYLIRAQRGQTLAQVVLLSQVCGTAASIAGLFAGWHVFSLGVGKAVTHVIYVLGTGATSRFFPGFRLHSSGAHKIAEYSKNILLTNLIGYAHGYTATLVIGLFLGPGPVGLYRAGARVAASLGEVMREPARIVCWMTLRNAVDEAEHDGSATTGLDGHDEKTAAALSRSSERFIALVLVLAMPAFVGLALTSESLLVVVLGDTWRAAAPVVSILAIARLVMMPEVLTAPLLSMLHKVDKISRLALLGGVIAVAVMPLSAPFGMEWAAVGQLIASLATTGLAADAYARHAAVSWRRAISLSSPSALACLAMVVAFYTYHLLLRAELAHPAARLGAELLLGIAVFVPVFTALGGWRRLIHVYAR